MQADLDSEDRPDTFGTTSNQSNSNASNGFHNTRSPSIGNSNNIRVL